MKMATLLLLGMLAYIQSNVAMSNYWYMQKLSAASPCYFAVKIG